MSLWAARAGFEPPDLVSCGIGTASAILLILSFPDFNLWPLAWISLIPLLMVIARRPAPWPAFLLGWLTGTIFFYGSCSWITYSMIHYGGLPSFVAYLLLVPGTVLVGLFPGGFALLLAMAVRRWGSSTLLLAPFFWISFEWGRLGLTGQLWNAIGYSQAYQPNLIQAAHWGGVYAVGFLIVAVNSALAFVLVNRNKKAVLMSLVVLIVVALVIVLSALTAVDNNGRGKIVRVIALQPNVPMHLAKTNEELRELMTRHLTMTKAALQQHPFHGAPTLVIWPESPMNFTYAGDSQFRDLIARFVREHQISLLFNSQEPAPNGGIYNSAMLINQDGSLFGQYDKIRLLPFGEYVPIPRWLPGAGLITGIVGDFEPGANYTMFPAGEMKAGVFICIESAYPSIARAFARENADLLINISNDGYLGRTAVMKQHLANAIFRAVENKRPVARVTNSGITAYITRYGEVEEPTAAFEPAVRVWTINSSAVAQSWYTQYGDLFVLLNATLTGLLLVFAIGRRRRNNTAQT